MPIQVATLIVLILIFLSFSFAIFLLLKTKGSIKIPISGYKIFNQDIRKELKLSVNKYRLDPHELKLIEFLSNQTGSNEVTVHDINELLNLTKLSKENQRQRRHIILKELNLKLFLITGIRETIIRVSSEKDRRIKSYVFVPEILEIDDLKELVVPESLSTSR
jgi:hypothetical protein